MIGDPQHLHDRFYREVPVAAQRAILRAHELAYANSWERCKEWLDERMRMQSWGYLRWLMIDSELLTVGERHGKVSRFSPNTEQSHLGHTELRFGSILLTSACVRTRGSRPRSAAYRDLFAADNQELFAYMKHHESKHKGTFWGVVLHVPNIASHQPLHVHIGFPTESGFAADLIDLRKVVEVASKETDGNAQPKLRIRRGEATGE